MPDKVTVLCSGFGLGFYLPGLLLRDEFRRLGVSASVEVFDSLLRKEDREVIERKRMAYQEDFRVAIAAQKIPNDIRNSWDTAAVKSVLSNWLGEDHRHFISLSGHWIHVLDLYREMRFDAHPHVDLLHLDADLAPSWKQSRKLNPLYAEPYNVVNLYDYSRREMRYSIGTKPISPISYAERNGRLVVHGGGWGIGTYRDRIPDLERAGYELDIVCRADSDPLINGKRHRYYMDDPKWRAWHQDEFREYQFPPFGELGSEAGSPIFKLQQSCHGLYNLIRKAAGLVSKPGAGTLIDSFNSATPLVLLDPFGPHEEANAELWSAMGFGIRYGEWASTGFQMSVLERLHVKLSRNRSRAKDYVTDYLERTSVVPSA